MDQRLRILKESGRMFAKYGIRSITMDHIANELGISKRTLYETFKDKDDLVQQAIEEGTRLHKKLCQSTILKSENVIDAIFSILRVNNDTFSKMNPLFFEDLKKYHSQIYLRIQEKGDIRDQKITILLLERGVAEGIFSSLIEMKIVNAFVHKIMDMAHAEEFSIFPKKELAKAVFFPYLYGISTDKGRELILNYLQDFNDNL
jgi:AcrR family transcriptional regulator